jgi:hypothetical protein
MAKYIEINGTLYECAVDLAELLEWLRLEQIRIKVLLFMRRKPLTGYIKRRPRNRHYGLAARPLIVYNRRSQIGRWLDEDILTEIKYSNKAMGEEPIWTAGGGVQIEFELPLKQIGDP